jgi:hypothetical protein
MVEINLFHDPAAEWEFDFIVKDLLINYDIYTYNPWNHDDIHSAKGCGRKSIMTVNTNSTSYQETCIAVEEIKPDILFVLSDECCKPQKGDFHNLADCVGLIFRQFNHNQYIQRVNIVQIPLGYKSGYTEGLTSAEWMMKNRIIPSRKKYDFCFVGEEKQDRLEAAIKFARCFEGIISFAREADMRNANLVSKYCLCPRGNCSLDTMRIYESLISGCIPVIVGSKQNFIDSLGYLHLAPVIYSKTWDEAVEKVRFQMPSFAIKSKEAQIWWLQQLEKYRNIIKKQLSS